MRVRRDLALFLLANLAYSDAAIVVSSFGGIYAAGVFGWGSFPLVVFAIVLTALSGAVAAIVGRLDDRFGSRQSIMACIAVLFVASLGVLGATRDTILYVIATPPHIEGSGLFHSASEVVFLAFACLIGATLGPLQASSRALLVRLAPPERLAQSFGLLALSGSVFPWPHAGRPRHQRHAKPAAWSCGRGSLAGDWLRADCRREAERDVSARPGRFSRCYLANSRR
jgi:MFS transporter, UMF1 family